MCVYLSQSEMIWCREHHHCVVHGVFFLLLWLEHLYVRTLKHKNNNNNQNLNILNLAVEQLLELCVFLLQVTQEHSPVSSICSFLCHLLYLLQYHLLWIFSCQETLYHGSVKESVKLKKKQYEKAWCFCNDQMKWKHWKCDDVSWGPDCAI